jgi:predicted house-cleaning NTP pyrophosphatase (Maf/HAM1 superfamily)
MKKWLTNVTWDKTLEREMIKLKILSREEQLTKIQLNKIYSSLDQEVNKLARRDNRNFTNELAAEKASKTNKQTTKFFIISLNS